METEGNWRSLILVKKMFVIIALKESRNGALATWFKVG